MCQNHLHPRLRLISPTEITLTRSGGEQRLCDARVPFDRHVSADILHEPDIAFLSAARPTSTGAGPRVIEVDAMGIENPRQCE